MTQIRFSIQDEALRKALEDKQLIKGPVRDFLESSARTVEGRAKEYAPVDTGRLANSITSNVERTRAIVGSNVVYAPFVEFGTRPHWPPIQAMQPWARRHGFPQGFVGAFLAARAIARRGTRAQPYLQPALKDSVNDIKGFLVDLGRAVARRWGKGAQGG